MTFIETPPANQYPPAVTRCRCCNELLLTRWHDPRHPKMQAAWLVECTTPGCDLFGVTATDRCYIQTTDQWLTKG